MVLLGISAYAGLRYLAYSEWDNAGHRAIDSCKETYSKRLDAFKVTFENVRIHDTNQSDLGRSSVVTGTAVYVDKSGTTKEEAMECHIVSE